MAPALGQTTLERRPSFDSDRLCEDLYRDYRTEVYRYTLRLVGQREDAEDVTQVAFLNAYRALARGNAPTKPRAWLLAIAHNVCMKRFRQRQRRPREVRLDTEAFASRAGDSGPTAHDIRSALQALGAQERSALLLREFQELSYGEIASRLGLSISAVETLLFRARRSLREQLETADITPSVAAGRPRTLGGILPWPPSLEKLFSWLASLGRGGLSAKAAGVTAAAVIGTGAVVGTGIVPTGPSPARGQPSEPASGTVLSTDELANSRHSAGRPRAAAPQSVADSQAPLLVPRTAAAGVLSAGGAVPSETGSTAGQSPTASQEAPPSVATPSPSLELPPPELEPPSLPPAPSVPEPPTLEPPVLPPPPELDPPELEPPALPPQPELDPPELEPPALPPQPELDPPEPEPPALPPLPPVPPLP
jgi:RNA polymerase sigma factor (sigma-70 family)